MMSLAAALNGFRQRYTLRGPEKLSTTRESVAIDSNAGLQILNPAPASGIVFGTPPKSRSDSGSNRYLWVIDHRGIPYIRESSVPLLDSKLPKHTNLTGGGEAYIGGELWFANELAMFVSGGSGRYPPIDSDHLTAAVEIFAAYQYKVESPGWNCDTGQPRRVLGNDND